MTYVSASAAIGRKAYWRATDSVSVLIEISDVKIAYGKVRYKIGPVFMGRMKSADIDRDKWVDADKCIMATIPVEDR